MNIEGQRTLVLWDEDYQTQIVRLISSLPIDPLKPWSMVLRAPFLPITPAQMGYYRGALLRVLSEYSGHDEDYLHAYLLHRFGERALIDVHHEDYCVRTFTTGENGTRPEMRAFMQHVIYWMAGDLGLPVPQPLRPGE